MHQNVQPSGCRYYPSVHQYYPSGHWIYSLGHRLQLTACPYALSTCGTSSPSYGHISYNNSHICEVWPAPLFREYPAVKAEITLDKLSDDLEGSSCQQETLNSEHKKPFPADAFWNAH